MTPVQVVARWVCAGCGRHATTTIRPDGHWRILEDRLTWCADRYQRRPDLHIVIREG